MEPPPPLTPKAPLKPQPKSPIALPSPEPVATNDHPRSAAPASVKKDKVELSTKIVPQPRPPSGAKTESLENMLGALPCLKQKPYLQHFHVLIYLPYKRWMTAFPKGVFGVDCFPEYEGWRNAWIKPINDGPLVRKLEQFSEPVFLVDVVFHDSFAMRAFITKRGELIVAHKPDSPMNGISTDPNFAEFCYDICDVSRLLTLNEMKTGIRGSFHGCQRRRKHPRSVGNIISSNQDSSGKNGSNADQDLYRVRKIPAYDYDHVEHVIVSAKSLKHFAPETVAEYTYRKKAATLSKADVKAISPYFENLFKRAMDGDRSARESYNAVLPPRNETESWDLVDILNKLQESERSKKK